MPAYLLEVGQNGQKTQNANFELPPKIRDARQCKTECRFVISMVDFTISVVLGMGHVVVVLGMGHLRVNLPRKAPLKLLGLNGLGV